MFRTMLTQTGMLFVTAAVFITAGLAMPDAVARSEKTILLQDRPMGGALSTIEIAQETANDLESLRREFNDIESMIDLGDSAVTSIQRAIETHSEVTDLIVNQAANCELQRNNLEAVPQGRPVRAVLERRVRTCDDLGARYAEHLNDFDAKIANFRSEAVALREALTIMREIVPTIAQEIQMIERAHDLIDDIGDAGTELHDYFRAAPPTN